MKDDEEEKGKTKGDAINERIFRKRRPLFSGLIFL
jgi:hypothetical protein